MGCCPWAKNSVAPADKVQSGKAAQKYVQRGEHAVSAPAVKAASPEELTSRVLDSLASSSKRVSVPVLPSFAPAFLAVDVANELIDSDIVPRDRDAFGDEAILWVFVLHDVAVAARGDARLHRACPQ